VVGVLLFAACGGDGVEAPDLGRILAGIPGPRATPAERDATRDYLEEQLAALGWTPELDEYATGANVLATVPATTADDGARIIVGAHFDTVANSPGADDNASGMAVVLAVGQYLASASTRRHPVTLVFFDEEEVGLVGARAYAGSLAPADVLAVHTVDQVGWDADGDRVFELELPAASLATEYQDAAAALGVTTSTTSTTGSDHEAFRERGFAAIGITEEYAGGDTTPYRHSADDTVDTVDLDYLTLAAQLVGNVIVSAVH
jgi:Zn-dependent M28 family amino/carboxypeptidase